METLGSRSFTPNISLAGVLLLAVLLLGPTVFLFQNLVESLGAYLANVMDMSFDVQAFTGQEGQDWTSAWTLFYWGWWISWAPFVGVFIARISRGRTVREFIVAVMLVPFTVGMVWFSFMGGSSLFKYVLNDTDMSHLLGPDGALLTENTLFDILGDLPLGSVFSVIAILVIAIFFITSSDSGSLVVDMLASGGHPNPPVWSRVLFALLEGVLAAALLLAGGLSALQAGSLITALPFSVLLTIMCVSLVRAFQVDQRIDYRLQATQGAFRRSRSSQTAGDTSADQTGEENGDQDNRRGLRAGREGPTRRRR